MKVIPLLVVILVTAIAVLNRYFHSRQSNQVRETHRKEPVADTVLKEATSVSDATPIVLPATRVAEWNLQWQPFIVTLGAIYAGCFKQALDAIVTFFKANPFNLSPIDIYNAPSAASPYLSLVFTLLIYFIGISNHYIHNVRSYFTIPANQPYQRVIGFVAIATTLSLFYIMATQLGPLNQRILGLILAILTVDLANPLYVLARTRPAPVRRWWIFRSLFEMAIISSLLLVPSPSQLLGDPRWAGMLFLLVIAAATLVRRIERAWHWLAS